MARKKVWDSTYKIPGRALPSAPRPAGGAFPRARSAAADASSGDASRHPYGARGASGGGGGFGSSSSSSGSLLDGLLAAASSSSGRIPSGGGTRALGAVSPGIVFGRPSDSRVTAQAGSAWASLLGRAVSGGPASVMSGFLGLGGLVRGVESLFGFGPKAPPPPLVEFRLPGSVSESLSFGSRAGLTVTDRSVARVAPQPSAAVPVDQGAAIAQAVKVALLNSSSLGDVIAEL